MSSVYDYFDREDLYPELDAEAAVSRLSEAVRCRTVNNPCENDFEEFDKLQTLICRSYPAVMAAGSFELIGHAVLITIPGTNPALRPSLYMSHQDVVPVVRGT
jgi:carboxypeptidase PM20D1